MVYFCLVIVADWLAQFLVETQSNFQSNGPTASDRPQFAFFDFHSAIIQLSVFSLQLSV